MVRFAVPVGLLFIALGLLFSSCGNPVKPEAQGDFFEDIALSVRDTLVDSITVDGKKFYNKKAFVIRIQENEPWSPVSGGPLFYHLYKVYGPNDSTFVTRLFGGGGGHADGDTVFYWENTGEIDTVHPASLDTLIIIGTEDKRQFQFGCAALTGAVPLAGRTYAGGLENRIIRNDRPLLGGVSRYFSINGGKRYTTTPRVSVSARLDTSGAGVLYWYRYSSIQYLDFADITAIDSLLKAAGPSDTQFVRINSAYRIRLADSVVCDQGGLFSGRYGGMDTIRLNALDSFFNKVSYGGEPGWISVEKIDTLPLGYGQKRVFLNSPRWGTVMYDDIDIQPFQGEIALDLTRALTELNALEKRVCLLSDEVPFVFRTFGDTTYDGEIAVWIATRNLKNTFMVDDKLTDFTVVANEVSFPVVWPDAILETPPQEFTLSRSGDLRKTLDPEYEEHYRVSPLFHLYHDGTNAVYEYDKNARNGLDNFIYRLNDPVFLSLAVKPGSILGYSEKNLNNFGNQDSIFNYDAVKKEKYKTPATGWFEFTSGMYGVLAPDNQYNPEHLVDYFGIPAGSLIPVNGQGNKYFSIYSAFTYSAEINFDEYWWANPTSILYIKDVGGPRLYRNPFRSLPSHFPSSVAGSKEFVLLAYAKGKYFKEPRVFISSFTSPYQYVWDKIPPHISWAASADPAGKNYAPMYYVHPKDKTVMGTDLSKTTIPYLFDVCLSTADPFSFRSCSVRDNGFGRISSVKLCFNYARDLISIHPITGSRKYSKETLVAAELSAQELSTQQYTPNIKSNYASYGLYGVAFRGIDARLWQKGVWDMWIETSDDLGNTGVAPYFNDSYTYGRDVGFISVRQIEIK